LSAAAAAAAASQRGFALPHLMFSLLFFSCGAYVSYIYQLGKKQDPKKERKL
jgi:hypothetical protein